MKRALLAGIFLGSLAALSPGWLFIGLLAAGIAYVLHRGADPSNRRFVSLLFLAGFAARVLLSLGLDLGSCAVGREFPHKTGATQDWNIGISDKTRGYLRIGDSDYYSARGHALVEYVRGSREPVVIFRLNQYGWNGYVDLIGFFYYVFGFSPSAVKGINCLLGAGCGTLAFFLALWVFNRKVARWSALCVTFFPSLMFWSVSNLKDIPFLFLTLLAMLLFIRLIEAGGARKRVLYGLSLALTLMAHCWVRELFYALLLASLLLAAGLATRKIKGWMLALAAAAGTGCLFLDCFALPARSMLAQLFHKHIGYTTTSGISYKFFPEHVYAPAYIWEWSRSGSVNSEIWLSVLKATAHFLLEPLPSRLDSLLHLPVLLQMLVWYGILLLAAGGILYSLKQAGRRTLYLLIPFLVFSLLIAVTNGNIGTLFRIRDLVTPFLLIYAAAGAERLLQPQLISGSRLAAAAVSAGRPLSLEARRATAWLLERRRRFTAGFRSSPARNAAWFLLAAVAANMLLLALRNTEWTGWNAGFRLGFLGLGLWGLAVRSGLANLWQESRLAGFFQRRNP